MMIYSTCVTAFCVSEMIITLVLTEITYTTILTQISCL